MSRAFIKEDSASEEVVIPPRAPLPPGTPNWVTPRGLTLLKAELAELQAEHERASDPRQLAIFQGRVDLLEGRISSAKVAPPGKADEVGFGATVTVRTASGEERRLSIVGVDEASIAEGRVSFIAPIARALMGHRVGDEVKVETVRGKQVMRVVEIAYL